MAKVKAVHLLLLACACACISPLLGRQVHGVAIAQGDPVWPAHFQGRALTELSLSERERTFLAGFPGRVARFTDGDREIVMRRVSEPTRRLHPAEDCYRGLGYATSQVRIVSDREQSQWRCFTATRGTDALDVCEQFQDNHGQRWTDVSAWYWAGILGQSAGPWLATTVASARRG